MPIDTSIYQQLKPAETPSLLDAQTKATNLSQLGLQNQKIAQDNQTAKMTAHLQKAQVFGNALEGLSGMSTEQRAQAYPKMRQELLQAGVISPEQAPEQFDENYYRSSVMRYRQTAPAIENQLKQAHAALFNAEAQAKRNESKNIKKTMTPGQEKVDEAFGKDIAEYQYGGGKENLQTNLGKLKGSAQELAQNPDLTGGITTKIPLLNSETAQDIINPKMAQVRDDIRGAIQGSLRQVLGAQFTEKEGKAIFDRAFNPRLSAGENLRRAQSEIAKLEGMAQQKDRALAHFQKNGTLMGFEPGGTDLSGGQAYASAPSPSRASGLVNEAQAGVVSKGQATSQDMEAIHWAQKNKSDPRAKQILAMHGVK